MCAGSFPECIGKVSSEIAVMVISKGYTILDPRWNRDENPRTSVHLLPLHDKAGQNIGLAVVAFKNPAGESEKEFFLAASEIRDTLIMRQASLFAPAPQP
jgi:hypothetical protein